MKSRRRLAVFGAGLVLLAAAGFGWASHCRAACVDISGTWAGTSVSGQEEIVDFVVDFSQVGCEVTGDAVAQDLCGGECGPIAHLSGTAGDASVSFTISEVPSGMNCGTCQAVCYNTPRTATFTVSGDTIHGTFQSQECDPPYGSFSTTLDMTRLEPPALEMIGAIENPTDGQTVAGITTIHGWALDGNGIAQVEWFIDGMAQGAMPYGGGRADVGGAYPEYPDSENSGFGVVFNWFLLSPGQHTVKVRLHNLDGATKDLDATVTVKAFHGEFVTSVGSGATWTLSNVPVTVGGTTMNYDIRYTWDVPTQGLRITDIIPK